mmetsp:Transcript_35218/g.90526  ORF Transcript_35218/g.90526 Transcript_35218/m.90526 type:complete len:202 (-) Transcript_35218:1670-2275(-)
MPTRCGSWRTMATALGSSRTTPTVGGSMLSPVGRWTRTSAQTTARLCTPISGGIWTSRLMAAMLSATPKATGGSTQPTAEKGWRSAVPTRAPRSGQTSCGTSRPLTTARMIMLVTRSCRALPVPGAVIWMLARGSSRSGSTRLRLASRLRRWSTARWSTRCTATSEATSSRRHTMSTSQVRRIRMDSSRDGSTTPWSATQR